MSLDPLPVPTVAAAAPAGLQLGPSGGMAISPTMRATLARKAARDFESFFVTSMLESMMTGLKTDKLFGGGQGESMYRSLLNQEYGKAIADRGSLGISDMVQREILRMQEKGIIMSASIVGASPSEIVGELLSVIERLNELLRAETAVLDAKGQPDIAASSEPKTRLVLRYEVLLRALDGTPAEMLRDVPGAARLQPAIKRLTEFAAANATAIDRHIRATRHVLDLVARAARRAAEPEFTYGRERLGYGIRSARRPAVAVNRVL